MTARVKFRRNQDPMKIIGSKNTTTHPATAFYKSTIITVYPSRVTVVKITRSEYIILSQLENPQFGLWFYLPQKYPSGHPYPPPHKSSSGCKTPVSILTHLFLRTP